MAGILLFSACQLKRNMRACAADPDPGVSSMEQSWEWA